MSANDYAPRSPDFSSFYPEPPTQPGLQHNPSAPNNNNHVDTHHTPLKNLIHAHPHAHSRQPPQFGQPERIYQNPDNQHYLSSQPTQHPYSHSCNNSSTGEDFTSSSGHYSQGYGEQPAAYPTSTSYAQPHGQDPNAYVGRSQSWAHSGQDIRANMPPRRAPPPPAPVIEPSPVRTKFPTARIKRIMQADEEVGKVAQQTPIAVGKALELFMIQLVSKSAEVAKEKGSKRVTASMLKQVVETDEQWDFLRDIVSRVENEKEGKARAKPESSSDEDGETIPPESKKRPRGGRKKKVE